MKLRRRARFAARFPARQAARKELLAFVQGLPRLLGRSEEDCVRLVLALEEAAMNVASYARTATYIGIRVDFDVARSRVTVLMTDDGEAFDPLRAAPPLVEGYIGTDKIGGLGIHLFTSLSSGIRYRRILGRNLLRLTFILPRA